MKKRIDYLINSIVKYPLVLFALIIIVSIILLGISQKEILIILSICCGLFLSLFKRLDLLIILFFCISLSIISFEKTLSKEKSILSSYINKEIFLIGRIKHFPYMQGLEQIIIIEPIKIKSLNNIYLIKESGLVRLKISKYYMAEKGDIIQLQGHLIDPPVFDNFDYKEYLKSLGIYYLFEDISDIEISHNNYSIVSDQLLKLRKDIIKKIQKNFGEPHASLLLGMLIGSREEFPGGFEKMLSITGTSHIIAVSGYNISLIIGFMMSFAGILPRRATIYLCFIVIFSFLSIVGFDNLPAFRAVIMGCAVLIGKLIGRRSSTISVLALAVSIMVLQNPNVYKALSFQLSFASTIGLVYLADPLNRLLKKIVNNGLIDELSVTLAAILATFPITFYNFGTINIWAPLANLLVAPLIPFIMLFGFIYYFLSIFSKIASTFLSYITWFFLELMINIIEVISTLPFNQILVNNNLLIITIFYLFLVLFFVLEINYKDRLSINEKA